MMLSYQTVGIFIPAATPVARRDPGQTSAGLCLLQPPGVVAVPDFQPAADAGPHKFYGTITRKLLR